MKLKVERISKYKFDGKEKATIKVKAGDLEVDINLKLKSDNTAEVILPQEFEMVKKMGLEPDFSGIIEEFIKAAANYEEYIERQREEKLRKAYVNLWYKKEFGYGDAERAYTHKHKGIDFAFPSFTDWMKRGFQQEILIGTYKNVKFKLKYVNSAVRQRWSMGTSNIKMKFQLEKINNSHITDSTRNYDKFETLIAKVKELIDEKAEQIVNKKKSDAKEEKRRNETFAQLQEDFNTFGWEVKMEVKEKYSQHESDYYKQYSYSVQKGGRKLPISLYHNDDGIGIYSIASIRDVDYTQVLAILDIL